MAGSDKRIYFYKLACLISCCKAFVDEHESERTNITALNHPHMKTSLYFILIALLSTSAIVNAQTTEQEEEHELSKKELRQQHREERKAARYEKHHHDDVEESEAVEEEEVVPVKTVKKTNVEEEVERALSEREATQSKTPKSKEKQTVVAEQDEDSKVVQSEEEPAAESEPMDWTWLYVTIFVVIVIWVLNRMHNKKCKACKSWNAMNETDRVVVDKKKSTVTKTLKTKNAKGEVIKTREQAVPATITTTEIHRQCSKCGHEDIKKETKKTEN